MTHAPRFALLLAVLLGLTVPTTASAQIYVDADATGANDGTSWTDAYTDLQTAIDNASSSSELWVAEGVYTPDSEGDSFTITGNKDGIALYGGFEGTESSRSARDLGANPTILSGDLNGDDTDPDSDGIIEDASNIVGGENAHHVLVLDGGDAIGSNMSANITTSTVIDGVVVTAGQADGSGLDDRGAGLYCDGFDSGNECSPTLRNVLFSGHAEGAIYNDGGRSGTSSPFITNAIFIGNADFQGGAIFNEAYKGTSSPRITNATFTGNSADDGGAIYNNGYSNGVSSPTITNTILWGNSASRDGDEIYNRGTSNDPPVLSHTIIQGGVNGSGVGGTGSNTDGGGNLDQDPHFVDPSTPNGPDGVFATPDDGVNVSGISPALDAGDNGAVPSGISTDITGNDRIQDRNGDGTARVNIGAYETEVEFSTVDLAITGGGFGGLDHTFSATPGQADQPIGVFRLTPGQSGADLTEVSVIPDNPGVSGVDRAGLWISDDDQFDPSGDTELASLDLDPQTDLPSPMTFDGFTEGLPGQARYLFVTVTLTSDASGEVTGYLASETALALDGGAITEVNGNSGQDQFSNLPLSGDASALPVEMASFEGTTTEDGVQLQWKTASEQNNAGFRVLRRVGARERGAESDWTEVGFVEGAGTTSEAQTYRFTDADLPYAADSVSYRLKQIDTDGSTSYTDPVTIARSGPEQVGLLGTYPNPAHQRATVRFAIPEGTEASGATLRLYDVMGRQVRTVTTSPEAGRHKQILDVSGLASGVYLLRLQADGQTKTRKLTVVQ